MLTVSLVTADMSTCGGFVLLLLGMKLQETELKKNDVKLLGLSI